MIDKTIYVQIRMNLINKIKCIGLEQLNYNN